MNLRNLEMKDANRMFEWMHNKETIMFLKKNFQEYTLFDCKSFIHNSRFLKNGCHFAITDEADEYMGTVSLKDIWKKTAEFAIVLHPSACGKGYASYAMKKIIAYGFENLNLDKIYWNVMRENKKAIRLYQKNGYQQVKSDKIVEIGKVDKRYTKEEIHSFFWYLVEKTANE